MEKLLCACFVLVLAVCFASTAWGQAQITSGTVQGDVLDEKGGSIAGATVEAKNLDTNFTQTETTNADGHFAFLSLAPGRYTLTISKQGFATVLQQNVNLTVGETINIPVTLKVSAVAQQIVVTVTESGSGPYSQLVQAGRHVLSADEPPARGGHDVGPSPYEFLSAGLGARLAWPSLRGLMATKLTSTASAGFSIKSASMASIITMAFLASRREGSLRRSTSRSMRSRNFRL